MTEQRKKIKIAFCDFFEQYNPENNMLINILKQKYDVTFSNKPDFLFYSCFGVKHKNYSDCIKIFYTNEAITPNFNDCDYAIGFDYINFGDRYIRKNMLVKYNPIKKQELTHSMTQRKFCNFIYSNAESGEGSLLRQDFCQKLMEYKHIDCPGKVLNNMQDALEAREGNWGKSKREFIANYKFTVAFENCTMEGYTTEKLSQPLEAHSIPIYWGNPIVAQDFNPKAFINCHDFNSFDEVIERIKYLDNNDEAYMAMLKEPPMQANYKQSNIHAFLYNIIEKGNKPHAKNPRQFKLASLTDVNYQEVFQGKYEVSIGKSVKNLLSFLWLRKKAEKLLEERKFEEVEALAYSFIYNNSYLFFGYGLLEKVQNFKAYAQASKEWSK